MRNIAVFASGKGSNTESIIKYFEGHPSIRVSLIITTNPEAGVVKIAQKHKVISAIISKSVLNDEEPLNKLLKAQNIELIVLAGFLQLIPAFLLKQFPKRIINIHPALLPKHGGKGVYGIKVHESVLANGEKETGFTIHYVNEKYDEGEVILQKAFEINSSETPDSISAKVQELEHKYLPKTIETLLSKATGSLV